MDCKYKVGLHGSRGWMSVPFADSFTIDGNGVLLFSRRDAQKPRPISELVAAYAPGTWATVAMTEVVTAGIAIEADKGKDNGAGV